MIILYKINLPKISLNICDVCDANSFKSEPTLEKNVLERSEDALPLLLLSSSGGSWTLTETTAKKIKLDLCLSIKFYLNLYTWFGRRTRMMLLLLLLWVWSRILSWRKGWSCPFWDRRRLSR